MCVDVNWHWNLYFAFIFVRIYSILHPFFTVLVHQIYTPLFGIVRLALIGNMVGYWIVHRYFASIGAYSLFHAFFTVLRLPTYSSDTFVRWEWFGIVRLGGRQLELYKVILICPNFAIARISSFTLRSYFKFAILGAQQLEIWVGVNCNS